MGAVNAVVPAPAAVTAGGMVRDYLSLTKPRIVVLLQITTWAAMVVAGRGLPPAGLIAATLVGCALVCGSANGFNCLLERDADRRMVRTRNRPLPTGRIQPLHALLFSLVIGAAGFWLLAAGANLFTAALALTGLLLYVFAYTLWSKPITVHNTVIGGLSGAVPPLVGWAAVSGSLDPAALLLFGVIFFWQPPHFWALATVRRDDYARAGFPMLSVNRPAAARRQSLVHSMAMVACSAALYGTGALGVTYLLGALLLGLGFVASAVRYLKDSGSEGARRLFRYSLLYVALLFPLMVIDILL